MVVPEFRGVDDLRCELWRARPMLRPDGRSNALDVAASTSRREGMSHRRRGVMYAWRTIVSAPLDGTRVIAWWPHIGHPVVAWIAQGGRKHGQWTCSTLPSISHTP